MAIFRKENGELVQKAGNVDYSEINDLKQNLTQLQNKIRVCGNPTTNKTNIYTVTKKAKYLMYLRQNASALNLNFEMGIYINDVLHARNSINAPVGSLSVLHMEDLNVGDVVRFQFADLVADSTYNEWMIVEL